MVSGRSKKGGGVLSRGVRLAFAGEFEVWRLFPFLEVIPLILTAFLDILLDPLFWAVVALVALQYRRIGGVRESFFGVRAGLPWREVLGALGFGILGGLAGSGLIVLIGLPVTGSGFLYLLPLSLLLMLFSPRFLCFAYSGGLLSLSRLAFGVPDISIPQVMGLVAILHAVESLLILVSGHRGAVPAYVKAPGGRVIGAFTLQKFWPIPITVLTLAGAVSGAAVQTPDWWPLISPGAPGDLALLPVVAGLGYGDIAIARSPAEKSRISALMLGIYSAALLLLALLAGENRTLALATALFAPLGHEALIYLGRRLEFQGEPRYVPSGQGVKVLDVLPGSPAHRAGIRSGDVILAVGGQPVHYGGELSAQLGVMLQYVSLSLDLRQGDGRTGRVTLQATPDRPVGIIQVPEGNEERYVELLGAGPLGRIFQLIFKKASR